jgi:hypothetical protein
MVGIAAVLLLPGIFAAKAMTLYEVELTCPLDGTKFKATLAGSGTSFGMFLDLKPDGPTPAPWPIAKCPSNGFVLYKDKFTGEEIARLRPFVESTQYQTLQRENSNYYLAARLRIFQGEKAADVAFVLVQATWEAKDLSQYQRYAAEALQAYEEALSRPYADPKQWLTDQLLAGELERRLGRFEKAETRFRSLADRDELRDGFLRKIVDLQLQLIGARNTAAERVPQERRRQ